MQYRSKDLSRRQQSPPNVISSTVKPGGCNSFTPDRRRTLAMVADHDSPSEPLGSRLKTDFQRL